MRMSMYMALDALAGFQPAPEIQYGEERFPGPQLSGGPEALVLREEGDTVLLTGGLDRILVRGQTLARVHDALCGALAAWSGWERRLLDVAAEGTLQQVVDVAFTLFDEPIFITDARDHITAITPHPHGTVNEEWDYILEQGSMPTGRLVDIYRDPLFQRAGSREGEPFIFNPPGMQHRGINMRFKDPQSGDWLGVGVIIEHKAAITIGKLHLAQSLYEAIMLNLRLHPAAQAAQAETRLLLELMEDGLVAPERAAFFKARLFPDAERFYIAVLRPSAARPVEHAAPMLERAFPGARCIPRERELCALFPYVPDTAERLWAVAAQADAQAGLSRPFSDWSRMAEYRSQAYTALEAGGARVNELSSRSVSALCAKVLREQLSGPALCHPALATLADYDILHHTSLLPTLRAYLLHERNLIRTAEALYIHRNSLVYRIRRIVELTGLALDDPDERLCLFYSFAFLPLP